MRSSDRPEHRRFFFVHMQKTGGTSLYMRLQREFGENAVYPAAVDGDPFDVAPQLFTRLLFEQWERRRAEIAVVTGHFPLCTTDLLGEEFTVFTVLRHPVERTLSFLRHHRSLESDGGEASLEAIYEDPARYKPFVENHMVKMLSLDAGEMDNGMMTEIDFDRRRLRTAKRALKKMELFGLQEELEDFAGRLSGRFGWRLGPPVYENATEPVDVPQSFRKRIAEDNRLDMELYEFARRLLRKRRR